MLYRDVNQDAIIMQQLPILFYGPLIVQNTTELRCCVSKPSLGLVLAMGAKLFIHNMNTPPICTSCIRERGCGLASTGETRGGRSVRIAWDWHRCRGRVSLVCCVYIETCLLCPQSEAGYGRGDRTRNHKQRLTRLTFYMLKSRQSQSVLSSRVLHNTGPFWTVKFRCHGRQQYTKEWFKKVKYKKKSKTLTICVRMWPYTVCVPWMPFAHTISIWTIYGANNHFPLIE